ncbi:PQQ-binding-like beta-propeller repeat protein [Methanocorpusculum sp. MG]|uniref:PQQ-binding-like beta-propeller repeat protein n=1 Tax=Methanocorpusculum petauri TaxID=3002863 RepID=A0ABT4IE45_9EURY|nr:PQQ-binding-like beta-propeller repeat protein [Methanocorpusculum petauri]MCZ0859997.1 PQQ-binding-like beta-propeller repeat protein [Methanocorpusculum petauri]
MYDDNTPAGVVSGFTVQNGKLFFGGVNGKLYCLDEYTGTILGQTEPLDTTVQTGLSSTPLVIENKVYVTSQTPAKLWVFSIGNDGSLTEEKSIDLSGNVAAFSSPSTDGTNIYTSGDTGFAAFDSSGTLLWNGTTNGPTGTPVYSDNVLYVRTAEKLWAFSTTTHKELWNITHSGYPTAPVVKKHVSLSDKLGGNTVTLVIANGYAGLTAYNATSGIQIWNHVPNMASYNAVKNNALTVSSFSISPNSPIMAGNNVYYTANLVPSATFTNGCTGVFGVNVSTGTEDSCTSSNVIYPVYSGIIGTTNAATTYIGSASPVVSNNQIFLGTGSRMGKSTAGKDNAVLILGEPQGLPTTLLRNTITVPPTLTLSVQGTTTPYASPLGLLQMLSEKDSQNSFSFSSGVLTQFRTISSNSGGDKSWKLKINEVDSTDYCTALENGDALLFYYSAGTYAQATEAFRLTAKVTDTFATVTLSEDYWRAFQPNDGAKTISAIVKDWNGNTLPDVEVSWSISNTGSFTIQKAGSLSATYQPTASSGEATITATYTPSNGNGASVSATTPKPIYIYNRITSIPPNPAIESTTGYTTWKGNPARTGVAEGTGPMTNNVIMDLAFKIYEDDKNNRYIPLVDGSPVIHDGKIYFTIWSGGMAEGIKTGMFCYDLAKTDADAETEYLWWNESLSSRTSMTVADGKIYAGTGTGRLVCLNAADGSGNWQTPVISNYPFTGLAATPLVYDDKVYVNVINVTDEKTTTVGGKPVSIATIDEYLYVFNKNDGAQIAKIFTGVHDPLHGDISGGASKYASPSLSPDGTIYTVGAGGIVAIDSTTNAKIWEFNAGARGGQDIASGMYYVESGNDIYVGSPVYKNQRIYFTTSGGSLGGNSAPGKLYCLNAITGEKIWDITDTNIKATTPVVTDSLILTTGFGLSAYDHSGTLQWHHVDSSTGGNGYVQYASPIVAGTVAYYGTWGQGLYAVNIEDGSQVWNFKGKSISGPDDWKSLTEATPAIYNGVLYVGMENGHFYGIKDAGSIDQLPFNITVPTSVTAGVEAVFTIDGPASGYNWDFGDGSIALGKKTVYKIWKNAGTYIVKAYIGDNIKTVTITVQQAPGEFTGGRHQDAVIQAETGVTIPTENSVTLRFSNSTVSSGTPMVTIAEFEVVKLNEPDPNITLDPSKFDTPPNTKKTLLKMNVTEVKNVTNKESLSNYAWLTINLPVDQTDKDKLSFWRYADGTKVPERLKSDLSGYTETRIAVYNVYIPGFSTIVATVDQTTVSVVEPPKENTGGTGGGGSSGSSYSGLSFTNVNPGTGDFEYTTPDGTTYTVSGMTAFGVLNAAGLTLETKTWPGGIYVNAINGLAQDANLNGWMYQVNGYAPMVMSNNYKVTYGDKVVWYYSDNKMSTDPAKSKKYYAFTVSTAVSATGGGASGQTIGQTAKPGTTTSIVVPAETKQIAVTIPDGISVEKLAVGQKITIDTAVTKLTGTVNVNSRSIVIIQPGIQITIPLADVVYNGDVATATIRGMTAEIVPVPVTVPKGGYSL